MFVTIFFAVLLIAVYQSLLQIVRIKLELRYSPVFLGKTLETVG